MAGVNGSVETDERHSIAGAALGVVGRGLRQLIEGAGFWSAIVLPFVAIALVVVQPAGWVPLLVGALVANVVGVLAGHCYGREC